MTSPLLAATTELRRPPWSRALPLMLLIAALSLPWLNLAPLFDVDEGAFSEATREMFASGDFLSTTLNGNPRFDKPILIYWLQAASVAAFGINEFAFRLPSALATLSWCLALWAFAAPRFGHDAARMAAWIGATSLGVLIVGRAATADALLNALLAATLFDAWRHFESGGRKPLLRMYLWMSLGVMTKGPIAILIPLAVTLLWAASFGQWRAWLRALSSPTGWAIGMVVCLPWYAYATIVHGRAFIDGFFLKHNVERFSGTLEGHSGSGFYYLLAVPLLVLPWTPMLGRVLLGFSADLRGRMTRFLWLWLAFVVTFFSFSGTKLPHYALYGVTPLFLLLARVHGSNKGAIAPASRSQRLTTSGVLCGLLLTALLMALPLVPWLVQQLATDLTEPRSRYVAAMALRSMEAAGPGFYAVSICAASLWLLWLMWVLIKRRDQGRTLAVGAGLNALVISVALAPWAGEMLAGPVKRAAQAAVRLGGPVVQWEIYAPSFSVYRQQVTPTRPPQPGELALMRIDRVPAGDDTLEEVFREAGLVLVRRKP